MENPTFIDEENIPMIHQDNDDYDDYNTPNTSRVGETSFIEPDATEATSTLQLRQKVKQDKTNALYKHLNVTAGPGLTNIDRFMIKKIQKRAIPTCFFSMVISIGNPSLISVPVSF